MMLEDIGFDVKRLLSVATSPHTILGVSILSGLGLRLALAFVPGYQGDQIRWAKLARNSITLGVTHIYGLTLRKPDLGIYPPLYHYLLALVGFVYQRFYSPSFAIPSLPLNFLLKLIPILGDCIVGLVIYAGVQRLWGENMAIAATLAFVFSPAVIYNSAYWGMFGDSLYTLCVLLALIAIYSGRTNLAWIAITAGVSLKPQVLAFVPMILWVTVKVTPRSRWYQAGLVSVLTLFAIWLPFFQSGTVLKAIAALRQTVGLFPVLSANAHNLWYLLSQGNSWTSDAIPLIGPFTARTLGLAVFGIVYIYVLFTSLRGPFPDKRLFSTAAYVAFAFFMLSTEMHENYLFPAISLLAFTCWQSKFLKASLLILTLTAFANMALHDPLIQPSYWLSSMTIARLTSLNSGINSVIFVLWTYRIVRGAHNISTTPDVAEADLHPTSLYRAQ